jgi:arylsulfatase A-like enzyme
MMPRDPATADTAITQFPWMDDITLQFALDGVKQRALGATPGRTDLLAVSLSTTDAVGHRYGPDSKELHDHVIQLDRFLGAFLDSLFAMRDSNSVIIALAGDHGMMPFPTLKSRVEPNEGAQRADLVARLATADTVHDAITRRWLHVFSPASDTTRLVVTLTPHSYDSRVTYATHGSPHDGDAHVPLVLRPPGIKAGRVSAFVRVVDLAPTLAELLGVTPGELLDGRALRAAFP